MERRGRALLRVLNTLVVAKVRTDAHLYREWTTARTVGGKPVPARGSSANTATTPVHPQPITVPPSAIVAAAA